jgi:hypothetical protein
VKNVNFTSGRRPCCQKRHLLKLTNEFHSSSKHYAFNKCILKALAQNVKSGKIAKDRRSRREFMLRQRHIVASDRQ